jgi:CHAT domain-containing protein
VAAGPDLPGARAEASAVAALYGTEPLLGRAASTAAVAAALGAVRIAHVAAHGNVHPRNPLFSAIRLDDGPFTVYELERVRWAPELVVLSSCNVGRAAVTAGGELLGLTATFLGRGTHQVVASVMPVPDAETAPLMTTFHELLLTGRSAAAALAEAQARADPDDLDAVAAAAGFVCLGSEWTIGRSTPLAERTDRIALPV